MLQKCDLFSLLHSIFPPQLDYKKEVCCSEKLRVIYNSSVSSEISTVQPDGVHGLPVSEEQNGQMVLLGQLMPGLILPSASTV